MEGRMDQVPDSLLRSVVNQLNPVRVILIGSRARGSAGPDSDIDLLVVVDDDTPSESLGWRERFEARRSFHEAVDILPCRASTFEAKRHVAGSLPNAADREGIVVYERR